MSQIKVAIADDHPLFRTALTQAVLKNVNTAEVLEAENFQELITLVENNPDIELIQEGQELQFDENGHLEDSAKLLKD